MAMKSALQFFAVIGLTLLSGMVEAQPAQAPEVIVVSAREQTVSEPIEVLGTLRANESAELTSSVTETIAEIRFRDGERVERGQVLVVMTNREQLAELAGAEANLAEAKRQFERVEDLAARGQESRAMLDRARRELDTARARLQAVEARLSDRLIIAPFDGVLGLRNVSAGSLLTPGMVITTLVDDSIMNLDFGVPELRLGQITEGLRVTAYSRAWPEHRFEGEVTSISNVVDPVTRSFQTRAQLENPNGLLRPGMLMTATLAGGERRSVTVPEEAILSRGREHHVLVVNTDENAQSTVERRRVELGTRGNGQIEIRQGLEDGQKVVVHGGFRLSDGQAVRIRYRDDGPGAAHQPRTVAEEP